MHKEWGEHAPFKQMVEEFVARNPPAKTFQSGGKSSKTGSKANPAGSKLPVKRRVTEDVSMCILSVEDAPSAAVECEVPILNGRAGAGKKLNSMPLLVVTKDGPYIKNETGEEAIRLQRKSPFQWTGEFYSAEMQPIAFHLLNMFSIVSTPTVLRSPFLWGWCCVDGAVPSSGRAQLRHR